MPAPRSDGLMLPRAERVAQVYKSIAGAAESQTLADIAADIGMSVSGVRPIIAELLATGIIRIAPSRPRRSPGRGCLPFRYTIQKARP